MNTKSNVPKRKQAYRGPEIVDVGVVSLVTLAGFTKVRDNPGLEPPDYSRGTDADWCAAGADGEVDPGN